MGKLGAGYMGTLRSLNLFVKWKLILKFILKNSVTRNQCFAKINGHTNHLRILLNEDSDYGRFRAQPGSLYF